MIFFWLRRGPASLTILRRKVSPEASRNSVTKRTTSVWPRKDEQAERPAPEIVAHVEGGTLDDDARHAARRRRRRRRRLVVRRGGRVVVPGSVACADAVAAARRRRRLGGGLLRRLLELVGRLLHFLDRRAARLAGLASRRPGAASAPPRGRVSISAVASSDSSHAPQPMTTTIALEHDAGAGGARHAPALQACRPTGVSA